MAEQQQDIIKTEQKRLDKIDTKIDQKVVVDGKDYAETALRRVDSTMTKLNENFGIKEPAVLDSPKFNEAKTKAKNAIIESLFQMDAKNIADLSQRLEQKLQTIEKAFVSLKDGAEKVGEFQAYSKQFEELKKSGNLDQAIALAKEFYAKQHDLTSAQEKSFVLNDLTQSLIQKSEQLKLMEKVTVDGVNFRAGDTIVLSTYDANTGKKITRAALAIKAIDLQKGVQVENRWIPLKDFKQYLTDTREQYRATDKQTTIGCSPRIIRTEMPSDLVAKEAQALLQQQAVSMMKQTLEEATSRVPLASGDQGPFEPYLKEKSMTVINGAVKFEKTFEQYPIEQQMRVLKEMKTLVERNQLKNLTEQEQNPERKLFAQAELALHEGRLAEAKRLSLAFLNATNVTSAVSKTEITTSDTSVLREKAFSYLENIQTLAIGKLRAANSRIFGKAAIEEMVQRKMYTLSMQTYRDAFSMVRGKNSEVLDRTEAAKGSRDIAQLSRDPAELFSESYSGNVAPEIRKAVEECEKIWGYVAKAETGLLREQSKDDEKTAYANVVEALRTIGEISHAEEYVAQSQHESFDELKKSEVIQSKKMAIKMGLEKHRDEYKDKIKMRFLEEHRGEDYAEIPEDVFNRMVDQAIDKAADGEIQKVLLKSFASQGDHKDLSGVDARLSGLYDNMANPNEKFFAMSDEEMYKLGDKVIEIVLEALVIGVSGGMGAVAGAGIEALAIRAGARQLIASGAALAAEAGAFELTSKTISPYLTGGPGFTNLEDFSRDYGKSLLMFGALKATGKMTHALKEGRAQSLATAGKEISIAEKGAHYLGDLGVEAVTLTNLAVLEEIASGHHAGDLETLKILGQNLQMITRLRTGGRIVSPITRPLNAVAGGIKIETIRRTSEIAPSSSPLFDFVKNVGGQDVKDAVKKFKEGYRDSVDARQFGDMQVAYSGSPVIEDLGAGLKNILKVKPAEIRPELDLLMKNHEIFPEAMVDGKMDPDLAKLLDMRGGMMKRNAENLDLYQKEIDQQAKENTPENLDPKKNREAMRSTMELIRESMDDPRTTLDSIYENGIKNANLTPQQKRMALATAQNMLEVGLKTGMLAISMHVESLRQLGVKTGIRPGENLQTDIFDKKKEEVFAALLAKNMNLPAFEGTVEYKIVSGVFVIKSSSDKDFANVMGGHVSHTTKGVALTAQECGMGVGVIFVRGNQVLSENNSVIRHELQHIFKQGSNAIEGERQTWDQYQAEVAAGGKVFIDESGNVNTAEIQTWFQKEKGDALVSFKDEALAFLLTSHMQADQIRDTLLKEKGSYDYLQSTSMWQERVRVMTRERPELQTQKFFDEVFRAREKALVEYRTQTKEILDTLFEAAKELQAREGIGQLEARERLCNQLMFVPIGEWPAHLREMMGRSEPVPGIESASQADPQLSIEQRLAENHNAFDSYRNLPWNPRYFALRDDVFKGFQNIDQGKLPETPLGEAILRLKIHDPEAYSDLRQSDFSRLFQTECLEAIIYGKKETMQDNNGIKVTIYVGRDIAKGGMGTVANVLYRAEGGTTTSFAVIKRPLVGAEHFFLEEMQAAETVSTWNHEHIVTPLHASPDRIMYETSADAENLVTALRRNDPIEQYAQRLIEVGQGLQEYQRNRMFHGDLKEANAMTFDGKTKIIDNAPIPYDGVLNKGWPATPGYMLEPMELYTTSADLRLKGHSPESVGEHLGRAIDLKAYGVMINQMIDTYSPDWKTFGQHPELAQLIADLHHPLKAGEPGMLEHAMEMIKNVSLKGSPPAASHQTIEPAKPALGATAPQKKTP